MAPPLLFRLPYGTPALYVNLTGAFPPLGAVEGEEGEWEEEVEYVGASHDNEVGRGERHRAGLSGMGEGWIGSGSV